jgi:Mrp family chromosome partitioning ATPase
LSSLDFALETIRGRTVLVTSTSKSDGKTATALNLAIAAAHDGRNPLLIDADERAQGLTFLAGFEGKPGVSDLNGPESVEKSTHQWVLLDGTKIDIVPAGTGVVGNTASFFRSVGFRTAMADLLEDRDIVIIDSPPVMAAAETTDVAAAADGVVLVVAEGARLNDLDDARQRLAMSGTPILGYVFNRATPKSGVTGYGYGYGYGTRN